MGQRHEPTTRNEIESLWDHRYHYRYYYHIGQRCLWERALYVEAEVLCYYNDYPFIHGNADIKHLSGDHIIYWIEWLEDDSAVWDIQIDTRKYFDTLLYIYLILMLDTSLAIHTLRIHQWRGMATVETYVLVWNLSCLLVGVVIWMMNYDIRVFIWYRCSYRDLSMDFVNQLSATSPWRNKNQK